MTFTASQIALALGRKRQGVQQSLRRVPPSSVVTVKGNTAAAWHFGALPAALQAELLALAQRRGYGTGCTAALAMLTAAPAPWQPRWPIADRPQADVDKAVKRRNVFEPFKRGEHLDTRPQAEKLISLHALHRKEFSFDVSDKTLLNWLTELDRRDGGAGNWLRLEIYLDDTASPSPVGRGRGQGPGDHTQHEAALGDTIRSADNPAQFTADDRKFIFAAAFRHLETISASVTTAAAADFKRSLIDYLWHAAPALAKNRAALKRTFNLKLQTWTESGGALESLEDKRPVKSGWYRRPDFTEDIKKIAARSLQKNNKESRAVRELRASKLVSQEFLDYYAFDPRVSKSAVPNSIRAEVTPLVEMLTPLHHGPDKARMAGPYITRNWDKVQPGDWFSFDDTDMDIYTAAQDENGQWCRAVRLCFLPAHDVKSDFVPTYKLIEGHHNALDVRGAILQLHNAQAGGIPHEGGGYYLENSVFAANLVKILTSKGALGWRETVAGLAEYGLRIKYTRPRNPRSKPIEQTIGSLAARMSHLPGACSRNERLFKFERLQKFLNLVKSGKADPREQLLTMEQLKEKLDRTIIPEHNNEPQNGVRVDGVTPADLWAEATNRRPLRKLPGNALHLLADIGGRVTIGHKGIIVRVEKHPVCYSNEETARRFGQTVLYYYSIENPDLLIVTDPNGKNPFTVKANRLDAMNATKEDFTRVGGQIAAHNKIRRELYGEIHDRFCSMTRDIDPDSATAKLGEFRNQAHENHKREQAEENRTLRKIQTAAAGKLLPVGNNIRNAGRVLQGIEMEDAWREENADNVPSPDAPPSPDGRGQGEGTEEKTYALDTPPAAPLTAKQYFPLWARVEKARPGLDRNALTQKTIGCNPSPYSMTPEQLAKMFSVFHALLRDSQKVTA